MIEIIAPGTFTTVQDGGRLGYAALGVPRSGAFDLAALRTANLLVGNSPSDAAVELTLGGLELRALDAVTVALTGAPCPGLDAGTPVTLTAGTELRLGTPPTGLRSYLAFRGGITVAPQLGSRSTDVLSGLGPAPLLAGDRLPIGTTREPLRADSVPGLPARVDGPLLVTMGPRADWFADPGALLATEWTIRPDSDRVGVRLDGPPLARSQTGELPSEPTLPGAIQVPPDGRPIVLGPDAPVTGGYPVIAVVRRTDLSRLGQLRPGDTVRFSARSDARSST